MPLDREITNKIKEKISQAKRILAIGHRQPDGDALGALLGMAFYFKYLKKDYSLFCLDNPAGQYQFLPFIQEVKSDPAVFEEKFDLVLVMDSGDLKYAGVDLLLPKIQGAPIINIDHHQSNANFGDINLVITDCSSVSEIVYLMLKDWQLPLNKDIATCLLNGIVFDTGAFSNAGTTLSSLKIAADLLNLGARNMEINKNFLRNKSLNLLKLWGRAFERLSFNQEKQMAFTVLTLNDFKEFDIEPENLSGLTNFFNELSGSPIVLVLSEQPGGIIKGSLRTTSEEIDVAKIAANFGGGGHKKAAGFTVSGRLVYNEGKWKIIE